MPDWLALAQRSIPTVPLIAIGFFGAIHAVRANTLYSKTHPIGQRMAKISIQLLGVLIVYGIIYSFAFAVRWVVGLPVPDLALIVGSLVITYIAAIILLRVPLTVTLDGKPIRPFKARDGAFEILLDRALVQEGRDVFARAMSEQLRHAIDPSQLDQLQSELEQPELSSLPEEAIEEARRYWATVLSLLARKHPEHGQPPVLLDRAAAAALAAVERLREASSTRVQRAIILAKFIDKTHDGTIPITSEESRRHPLYMRLGGLHAYMWSTAAMVTAMSSVAISIERPRTQISWASDVANSLRRDANNMLGFFGNSLTRPMIDYANSIDDKINVVAGELVMTGNLLLKLLTMALAGVSATLDPNIRQLVLGASAFIFVYYLISGSGFRYAFLIYIWSYAGLTLEMYYRYFTSNSVDSLRTRLDSLATSLDRVPGLSAIGLVSLARQSLDLIGKISGYALAAPGAIIWCGSALYFTWYILSKEAALVTFDRRMRKPGF